MKPSDSFLLIVDDNEDNLHLLSLRLQRRGYNVETAHGGKAAIAQMEQHKFDLVLLDIMMPEVDGFEVLSTLRKTYSITELPIIMATAKDESEDVVKALRLGANDYVTKPVDFPVLLARVQSQLQAKSLFQLKDEFLKIASHDLKNPLWSILTASQMLEEAVEQDQFIPDQHVKMLKMITRQANLMQQIITDFVDFQAAQDGQLILTTAPLDLNEVARKAVENNTDYAHTKGIKLQLQLTESLPEVIADEARLSQVAHNLVSNAIKFTRKQGNPTTVITRSEGDQVWLEISDSGPGLSEQDFGLVFGKYARLSNRPTGGEKSSGLGLAICKQMIELHGGQIGVRNNPTEGATFWFSLPVKAAS